jgi:hypothetical protein
VNADHDAQLRLLEVQAADTALAQLAHRRAHLPELAAIVGVDASGEVSDIDLVEVQTALGDVAAEQARLENEVDVVRSRSSRDDQRLQAGGLPAKELEGLQHEIATLARRQGTLEDELLEVMERREQLDTDLAGLQARRGELDAQRHTLVATRDAAFAEIDAASALRSSERAEAATTLPAELMSLYERAREHGAGVGAAALRQRRCEGCHIELSGTELATVRAAAADEVVRCDNCRRILVRTADSGL